MMSKGTITDPHLKVRPSEKLCLYIKENLSEVSSLPSGIKSFLANEYSTTSTTECGSPKNSLNDKGSTQFTNTNYSDIVKNISCHDSINVSMESAANKITKDYGLITLKDVVWLYDYTTSRIDEEIYFHEILEGCEIIFPENTVIPRSTGLEKRCEELRNMFANEEYKNITKNVRLGSRLSSEDNIAHVMKEINKQMIAVFQFILSVFTGFAFGFIGVELMIGKIPVATKLVLGIFAALSVASAELYFLIKKLDQEELKT